MAAKRSAAVKNKLTKTILVRSEGRIVIPKKISLHFGIFEGAVLNFVEPKSGIERKVTVQPSDRVVIPLEIREALDIVPDSTLVFLVDDENTLKVTTLKDDNFFLIVP